MRTTRFTLSTLILLGMIVSSAGAQTLQLPSYGVNAVQTAVSVPDRGSALLGGVSRGVVSSNRFGFTPLGSAVGRAHSNAAQRVFVTIHDFEEADRLLLSADRDRRQDAPKIQNRRARHAWQQLNGTNR